VKTAQPELKFDDHPREIVTENSEDFFALCERDRAGELVIESVQVGDSKGQWICRVKYVN